MFCAGFIVLVLAVMLALPSPFAVEMPGPTVDVLGKVSSSSKKQMIEIQGAKTYKNSGQLRLVTVSAMGVPGYPAPTISAVWAWFDSSMAVMPQEAVYSVDENAQDYEDKGNSQMTQAQDTASVVAQNYLKTHLGIDATKAKITLHVDDIGGPSAGMMYTLGTISKLTEQDEVSGKRIAGTGTISADGKIGAIGGIQLKMLGAKRDSVQYFLAPLSNCDEVIGHIPDGLQVFAVSTIDEAYQAEVAIGKSDTSQLHGCSAHK